MTITVVQGPLYFPDSSNTHTSLAGTMTGTTAGNMLVIIANWHATAGSPTLSSVAVSGESNATIESTTRIDDSAQTGSTWQIAHLNLLSSGGSKTVTMTVSATAMMSFLLYECAGQAASPFNVGHAQRANGSSTATSIITTVDHCAVFVGCGTGNATTTASGTGFVYDGAPIVAAGAGVWSFDSAEHNLDIGVAGTYSPAMGLTSPPQNWAETVAAFAPAAAPVGGPCIKGSQLMMGIGCGIWAAKKIEENPRMTRRGLFVPRRSLFLPRR